MNGPGGRSAEVGMAIRAQLETLRCAVLALNATGEAGFEGLLAALFESLTSEPFRLAASGLQLGEDVANIGDTRISIEGKLYTRPVPRAEVLNKIADVAASGRPTELWVLGASVAVSVGVIGALKDAGHEFGLAVLVLDWPENSIAPLLPAALALAPDVVSDFLDRNLKDRTLAAAARPALATLARAPELKPAGERIKEEISSASLGLPLARQANATWLKRAFSDRRRAAALFGQPLAPLASVGVPLRDRSQLVASVREALGAQPPSSITAILGDEGCGKTWLAAEGWRSLAPSTVLLFASATDAPLNINRAEDLEPFLVGRLIDQTGEMATDTLRARWRRRLGRWKKAEDRPSHPRFILLVDGLNQASTRPWGRWLDTVAILVEELGGGLALTSRSTFFKDYVAAGVRTPLARIIAPEWSETELDEILLAADATESLSDEVRARLRNPRLLSIALELRRLGHITTLTELTVGRLLFEHIRTAARDGVSPDPSHVFAQHLVEHAVQILARIRSQQRDDRLIFSASPASPLADLQAVTGERFFQRRQEDAGLYALTDDGLDLALGLAIIRQLQSAIRNGREVADALREIIEPIAALDRTASAMLAAASVAVADEDCSDALREALFVEYLSLQNLDETAQPAFAEMLRFVPESVLYAHARIATSPAYIQHAEWIAQSVDQLRADPANRDLVDRHIRRWLRTYSLNPTLAVTTRYSDGTAHGEEITEREADLKSRWKALPDPEREIFHTRMHRRDDIDPGELHRIAFSLLAGRSLAPFADDLVACAMSEALNASLGAPYDVFTDLIRFNLTDWADTAAALRQAVAPLATQDASWTGKWAHVAVLRALATHNDAAIEADLVEELTRDRDKFGAWRLVETFSSSDPCDPTSVEPANIGPTTQRFAALTLANLGQGRQLTSDDHFLEKATPSVARFKLETAVSTLRRIAAGQLRRDDVELRIVLGRMRSDAALLQPEHVDRLLEIARSHSHPRPEDGTRDPFWAVSQYALLLAFPHLTGAQQVQTLSSLPPHGPLMLSLLDVVKLHPSEMTAPTLQDGVKSGEETRILGALAVAAQQEGRLDAPTSDLLANMLSDDRSGVRAYALSVIAARGGEDLLRLVAQSDWRAEGEVKRNDQEAWNGSAVLVRAAQVGLLTAEEAIDRINPIAFGVASRRLGPVVTRPITHRLSEAVEVILGPDLPTIDLQFAAEQSSGGRWATLSSNRSRRIPRQLSSG